MVGGLIPVGQNPGAGRPLVTFWIKCMEMPIHFIDNRQQWTFCPGFCPTAGTLYQPRGDCFKNAGSQCRMIFGLS